MGLDAWVYCNCLELNRLTTPPPFPDLIYVDGGGGIEIKTDDFDKELLHDSWIAGSPCQHDQLTIKHHRLGNISAIGWMREVVSQLSRDPETEYPVLWSKVIYSGCHAGDFLRLNDVIALADEINRIEYKDFHSLIVSGVWQGNGLLDQIREVIIKRDFNAGNRRIALRYTLDFFLRLKDLIYYSLMVNKPIDF